MRLAKIGARMTEKRFQIFVSSTFEDLKEERKTIQEAILRLDHFPAGMEGFPATDDSAWELIKQVIDTSDYYLLIIAGRYGSQDDQGTSYTEKEYNYAVEFQKPVIAFIHGDSNSLPHAYVERTDADRDKLKAFIERVRLKHHCKFSKDKYELQVSIYPAIQQLIKTKPALGWTRQAVGPTVDELNRRLVEIQSKFDACKAELDVIRNRTVSIDEVLSGEIKIDYDVHFDGKVSELSESKSVVFTWAELFLKLGKKFEKGIVHTQFLIDEFLPDRSPNGSRASINILNETENKIMAHFFNAGVIDSFHRNYSQTSTLVDLKRQYTSQREEVVWILTDLGKKFFYANVASRLQQK